MWERKTVANLTWYNTEYQHNKGFLWHFLQDFNSQVNLKLKYVLKSLKVCICRKQRMTRWKSWVLRYDSGLDSWFTESKGKAQMPQVIPVGQEKVVHQLFSKFLFSSPHFHTGSSFPAKEIWVRFPDGISDALRAIPASTLQAAGLSMLCSRRQQRCTLEKSLSHACVGGFRELQL